ncbi:MAG TPA: F0F1 ATP synthase subunit A [Cyclobacteriaceae bacterium]|jgi:F-type H+-transporting ATPase subunit a
MTERILTLKKARKYLLFSLLICSFLLANSTAFAQEEHAESESFDAGKMIMEHILDSHEWHVFTFGHFHGTVPLPVILYSPTNGLAIFMSSKFHHGEETYAGYKYEEGKIESLDGNVFYDISITKNVVAMLFSMALMCWVLISVANTYKRSPNTAPKGVQSLLEPIIIFVKDEIAKPSIGEERYQRFLPFLLTVFFFIWLNNMLGLVPIIPGGANLTGNIAVTMVLAMFTFVITTFSTNKGYWVHIFNTPGVPWWLKFPIPIMPLVEFMTVFTRPSVLLIRLFANITAGHIIALVFVSMIFIFGEINIFLGYGVGVFSVLFNVAMTFLELLVGFIQAYVFTLLSALYFGMAKVEEHH